MGVEDFETHSLDSPRYTSIYAAQYVVDGSSLKSNEDLSLTLYVGMWVEYLQQYIGACPSSREDYEFNILAMAYKATNT